MTAPGPNGLRAAICRSSRRHDVESGPGRPCPVRAVPVGIGIEFVHRRDLRLDEGLRGQRHELAGIPRPDLQLLQELVDLVPAEDIALAEGIHVEQHVLFAGLTGIR